MKVHRFVLLVVAVLLSACSGTPTSPAPITSGGINLQEARGTANGPDLVASSPGFGPVETAGDFFQTSIITTNQGNRAIVSRRATVLN